MLGVAEIRTILALVVAMAAVVSAFAPVVPIKGLGALGTGVKAEQCPQAASGLRVGGSREGAGAAVSMDAGKNFGFAKRGPTSEQQGPSSGQVLTPKLRRLKWSVLPPERRRMQWDKRDT